MDRSPNRAALEISDETEPTAIPGTEGMHTMTIESSTDKSMKASDVRFFWIEEEGLQEDFNYHWAADCAWVAVAVWHGGRLVASEAPPPGAADTAWVRKTLEERLPGPAWHSEIVDSSPDASTHGGWLCVACRNYLPRPVAVPLPAELEPCEKCGCAREMHIRFRGPFDRGCSMCWDDAIFDADGQLMQFGLKHCPCDGYAPPPGGRPLTSSDFAADGLSWRGD